MRLHQHLEYWARVRPEAEYLIAGAERWSYARSASEVGRLAGALAASGVAAGTRVAILARNRPELPLLCFACSRLGAVPVPLNVRLAPREWVALLADSGARLVLAEGELASALSAAGAELPELALGVAFEEAPAGWLRYADWAARSDARAAAQQQPGPEASALQLYTSGTTGVPKGALLSQRALFAAIQHWVLLYPLQRGERQLCVLPMFHIAGLQNAFHAAACGAAVYLMRDYDAAELVRALAEERVVRAPIVPTMLSDALALPGSAGRSYEALRWLTYGGAPIGAELLRRGLERFDCGFQQAYGMTELSCITYLSPDDHRRGLDAEPELLRSVGQAGPGVELRIVDPEGRELPPGEVGEILARGPQLMSGYWRLPEATAEALRGGWLHTGDAGRLDERGYLTLVDRLKDVVVSGGENLYPREIEELLQQHPAIAEVAVIGVPDARWGEALKAVVVLRAGASLDLADLEAFCRGRIGGYKRPRLLEVVPLLPRNASGKVLKRELRERHARAAQRAESPTERD